MDFSWVAIALGDVAWMSLAFVLGFAARSVNLPPLVGFLLTGFVLNYMGITSGEMLQKLADLGITLLLFTIGLKLNLKVLIKPQVWAVTVLHIFITVLVFSSIILLLASLEVPLFSTLNFKLTLLLAFAFSFSSTVFAVKALEAKGAMGSLHGRIAIGVLVIQDLAAVIFLAVSMGKVPSLWALLLLLLIPLRPFLFYLLNKTGHGELLILYGLVLALGGAELFEIVGVKDDLGALILGVLISSHVKAKELAKTLLGFKDLFLIGFFLSIGMSGQLSIEALLIGLLIVPLVFIKSALFFTLMTRFKLRARTSLLATINLSNYSEFGLIVAAIAVSNGWLDGEWLVVIAIALSFSFVVAAPLSMYEDKVYSRFRSFLILFQTKKRLPEDALIDTFGATIAVLGMGRVGYGAYKKMHELYGDTVVGIDFDAELVKKSREKGINALHGDPGDSDFWDKVEKNHKINLVMLALPSLSANLDALAQIKKISFSGTIAATARYADEIEILKNAGATKVFNIYSEAGAGFAEHISATTKL